MFPGQGAQYPAMGKDFYHAHLSAKEVFQEADDLLSMPLSKLIFQGSVKELALTKNSQIAIFVTSIAILRVLQMEFPDLTPHMCGGLSLGEYTALVASKKANFAEIVKVVFARGCAMQEACELQKGSMLIILGLSEESIKSAGYFVANANAPGQIVIGGSIEAMEKAEKDLKERGARRVLRLDVSGAFHTPLMKSAEVIMIPIIKSAIINESSIRFVMNVVGDFVSHPDQIRELLIEQITKTTRWEKCVERMEKEEPELYIEVGPSQVAGINRKIGVRAPTVSIEKIEDLEDVFAATSG